MVDGEVKGEPMSLLLLYAGMYVMLVVEIRFANRPVNGLRRKNVQ